MGSHALLISLKQMLPCFSHEQPSFKIPVHVLLQSEATQSESEAYDGMVCTATYQLVFTPRFVLRWLYLFILILLTVDDSSLNCKMLLR
jgi:hypothetical protein